MSAADLAVAVLVLACIGIAVYGAALCVLLYRETRTAAHLWQKAWSRRRFDGDPQHHAISRLRLVKRA